MRYEIRAMSVGEILDMGLRLVRDHFGLLVTIALILYLPVGLLGVWLRTDPNNITPQMAALSALPVVLVFLLAGPVVSAAITYALGESYLGRTVTAGQALQFGWSILMPLVGTSILSTLAVAGGFVLLIIPGILVMLYFLLLSPVMILERTFGLAALRRSRELMRGNLGRGFGIVVVGWLIVAVASGGFQLLLAFTPTIAPIGNALAQAVSGAYLAAVLVVLYFDIRCRKEAFDLEHLAALVAAKGAVPTAGS